MKKKYEMELLFFLTEKGGVFLEKFKNLKMGPTWTYNVVENDQLKNAGYFQIIEVDNNENYFCIYQIEDDKLVVTDFAICSMMEEINTLTFFLDRREKIDATGEIVFWPGKGYWMKVLETNEFWKLVPGTPAKQSEQEFWENKNT